MVTNWNPDLYLKFEEERTQPARDLTARIPLETPRTIADLGCGPGNSTEVLRERWPEADILGLDSSAEMVEKAKRSHPHGKWLLADIREWEPEEKFDVLSSNATLQWIPDHRALLPRLFSLVRPGGVFAVQLPANQDAPLHRGLIRVSSLDPWKDLTAGCADLIVYQSPEFYYEILSALTPRIQMWKSVYYHVLENHQGLIDWYSSTGMRTYLERLPDKAQKESFKKRVLEECREAYPLQRDGRILYPFERLFFIAYRP